MSNDKIEPRRKLKTRLDWMKKTQMTCKRPPLKNEFAFLNFDDKTRLAIQRFFLLCKGRANGKAQAQRRGRQDTFA
jgi:hypothetical protein